MNKLFNNKGNFFLTLYRLRDINIIELILTKIIGIKDGLQIELFGSLQALHTKLIEQHYATAQQKTEAKLYYTQIHNLGKDGWSEQYYQEIMELPESREEYWRTR